MKKIINNKPERHASSDEFDLNNLNLNPDQNPKFTFGPTKLQQENKKRNKIIHMKSTELTKLFAISCSKNPKKKGSDSQFLSHQIQK